jgi:hypothetical protein
MQRVTACFVPSEQCKKQALSLGLRESQLVMHGLPIRPQVSGLIGLLLGYAH